MLSRPAMFRCASVLPEVSNDTLPDESMLATTDDWSSVPVISPPSRLRSARLDFARDWIPLLTLLPSVGPAGLFPVPGAIPGPRRRRRPGDPRRPDGAMARGPTGKLADWGVLSRREGGFPLCHQPDRRPPPGLCAVPPCEKSHAVRTTTD